VMCFVRMAPATADPSCSWRSRLTGSLNLN
jgi:hypothetical protein